MKKTLLALGAAGLLLVPTQRAQAIIGFGLNVGQDGYTFASKQYTGLFGVPGINFTRAKMEKPVGIAVYLFIDVIPFIDLEAGFDLYGNLFDITYVNPSTGQNDTEEFGWGRIGGYLSIQRKLFKVPMFNVYAGGGLSSFATIPPLDDKLMEKVVGGASDAFNVNALEDEVVNSSGFHVEVGARFKPIFIPFALNARFRLTFVNDIVPGKSSFSTISVGLGFQI